MSDANKAHPSPEDLTAFLNGMLSEQTRQEIETHVASCDSCCEFLSDLPQDQVLLDLNRSQNSTPPGETQIMPERRPLPGDSSDTGIPDELVDHPRYLIQQRLGEGGMGVVYRAEHRLMERSVALKVINTRLLSNNVAIQRFQLEVKAAAKLAHRNIVAAYDAEQAGELHFLVMEFIAGSSLYDLVQRKQRLSVLHACNYIYQAAQGLQHAHERGMVHRDIKPHNLMRTEKGTIKILDFGLARLAPLKKKKEGEEEEQGLTGDRTTLGTPDYIAPEQARDSKSADIRADIYSLGCTFYFLLTGQVPFPKGTGFDKIISHCEHTPTSISELRPDLPTEVAEILEKMMQKEPEDRYQTPAEVVEALKPFSKPASTTIIADSNDTDSNKEPADQDVLKPSIISIKDVKQDNTEQTGPLSKRNLLVIAISLILLLTLTLPFIFNSPSNTGQGNQNNNPTTPQSIDWVDLISEIDIDRDTVAGYWENADDQLSVSSSGGARLAIPYQPTREYDLEVTFTKTSGQDSISVHFISGTGNASFDIDGWGEHLAGIQNIAGQSMQDNATRSEGYTLEPEQQYTVLIEVRADHVNAYLNGELVTTYHGDGSDLSLLELWSLPQQSLGLGSYNCEVTFHSVRIRAFAGN